MGVPTPIRIQRRKPGPIARFWWVFPVAVALGFAGWRVTRPRQHPQLPTGYIASADALEGEYLRFEGREMVDHEIERRFQEAGARAAAGDDSAAIALLEEVAGQAPLPVVFNDLGVLYARKKDRSRTVKAFRHALARDLSYAPARANLDRLRDFVADSAEPVASEAEPNDTNMLANTIALGRAVEGAIGPGQSDVDCYSFITPPRLRDIVSVHVENKSGALTPMLSFYDSSMRLMDWKEAASQPGASLDLQFSPEPNATFYVHVRGYAQSTGAYMLTVRALKASDEYEPNDSAVSARRVEPGRTIEANIMDAQDTDYYSFLSPREGSVAVEIRNRSATLVPALTTFGPDMRFTAFGPDVRKRGADLKYQMPVRANQVYFIQVWPAVDSAGTYSLSVK